MSHRLKAVIFGVLVSSLFLGFKASVADDFNPNFIISDVEMQDFESMGRGEIQAFLVNKKSFLSSYIAEDKGGKNKRAADIIYDAAREYRINPKYILVMLQKEQSLVSDPDPSERQLDFATGYSVCDSCSFTEEKVLKYKGFGKQVDAAAGIMRWYYDHVKTESWIKQPLASYAIDGIPVSPANFATGFLYTYTPHIEGNKNFWKLWQNWFKQVYPDGTLLKALNDPSVYFIQDGKKRLIKSMSALVSRFDPRAIIEVPIAELARYETGAPLAFANYSILEQGGTYYLLDFDTLRPFENQAVFKALGYNPDEVIKIKEDDLLGYSIGTKITAKEQFPFGRILSIGENRQLYYVKSDSFAPVLDKAIAKARFPQLSIDPGSGADLEGLEKMPPLTFPDGVLMGDLQSGKVYVTGNGKRKHITSETVFNGLGYNWKNVIWVNQFISDLHPLGEPLYLEVSVISNNVTPTSPTIDDPKSEDPTTTPSTETIKLLPKDSTLPYTFPENGKVLLTPSENSVYEGAQKIDTRVDVYIVADEKGNILAGKNIDVVRPIASLTKIMTAYRLFNEGIDLNKATVYKAERHRALYHAYRISEGEAVKNDDLLKAMLVTSRNTPARMLASSVEPNESAFISRMNAQAKNWGLSRTYFADTYGYDLRNQSTARDYVRLFAKALENETIKKNLGIKSFEYDETLDLDNQPHHAGVHTNLLMKRNDLPFTIISSKTGFLNESGYNLATFISRKSDGKKFYIITMGEPDYASRDQEIIRISNWALNSF